MGLNSTRHFKRMEVVDCCRRPTIFSPASVSGWRGAGVVDVQEQVLLGQDGVWQTTPSSSSFPILVCELGPAGQEGLLAHHQHNP